LKLSKRIQHRGPDWSSLHADGENFLAHQARREKGSHTGKVRLPPGRAARAVTHWRRSTHGRVCDT